MRDLQECTAEVFRRSEKRIRRRRAGKAVVACCIPLALCVAVLVSASLAGGAASPCVRVYGGGTTEKITNSAKVEQIGAQLEDLFATGGGSSVDGGAFGDLGYIPPAESPGGELETYTITITLSGGSWGWYILTGNELRDQKSHETVELTDTQLASLKALLGLL